MGRAEYWDPTTQSRKPIKSGSIVDDTGLEYAPSDVKAIDDKIGILNGVGETKEKANKVDLAAIQDEVNSHKADNATIKHKAKEIGLEDTSNNFTNKNVEGAMNELFTNVSSGKDLVGGAITGVDENVVIPTDPTFGDLASAISGISTGKKWASGYITNHNNTAYVEVSGLPFKPSVVLIKEVKGFNSINNSFSVYMETSTAVAHVHIDSSGRANPTPLDGINRYVINGGFRLYVQAFTGGSDDNNIYWIAFE